MLSEQHRRCVADGYLIDKAEGEKFATVLTVRGLCHLSLANLRLAGSVLCHRRDLIIRTHFPIFWAFPIVRGGVPVAPVVEEPAPTQCHVRPSEPNLRPQVIGRRGRTMMHPSPLPATSSTSSLLFITNARPVSASSYRHKFLSLQTASIRTPSPNNHPSTSSQPTQEYLPCEPFIENYLLEPLIFDKPIASSIHAQYKK